MFWAAVLPSASTVDVTQVPGRSRQDRTPTTRAGHLLTEPIRRAQILRFVWCLEPYPRAAVFVVGLVTAGSTDRNKGAGTRLHRWMVSPYLLTPLEDVGSALVTLVHERSLVQVNLYEFAGVPIADNLLLYSIGLAPTTMTIASFASNLSLALVLVSMNLSFTKS
jgi:hypothetical protein